MAAKAVQKILDRLSDFFGHVDEQLCFGVRQLAADRHQTAIRREPESPEAFDQIALAYGRNGDLARADLASAQASFTRGDLKTARALAGRAKSRFPVGSPGWVKADDIASYKPKAIERQ